MKKTLLLVAIILSMVTAGTAQNRIITRGAVEEELYLSTSWYGIYTPGMGPPFYTDFRRAVVRLTENGKKAELMYGADVLQETGDMQPGYIIADATPGVLYNKGANDHEKFWVSFDYGKTWIFRENFHYPTAYCGSNKEGLIYRGGRNI